MSLWQGSRSGGRVPTGGAGHKGAHERGDGKTDHNDAAGGWMQKSTCPPPEGSGYRDGKPPGGDAWRFAESILGCAAGNDERCRLGEGRYRYGMGNLYGGIQRAWRVLCSWAGWVRSPRRVLAGNEPVVNAGNGGKAWQGR